MADRLVRLIQEPMCVDDHQLSIGASAGIVTGSAAHASELMIAADRASYAAKHSGGNLVSTGGDTLGAPDR